MFYAFCFLVASCWTHFLFSLAAFLFSLGHFSLAFFGVNGLPFSVFFKPGGSLGTYFEGLGVSLGRFGAQPLPKIASLFRATPFLDDFGAQGEPKRLRKLIQKEVHRGSEWNINACILETVRSIFFC